ncbi:MAG: permease-like cell division protein FtsX [Actinocatenispora sp.]
MRAKYVLSEVFLGLWRNVTMTIAMIITMAVSLSMLGASLLLYWKVQDMRDFFYTQVEMSVFLKNDISTDQRIQLQNQLKGDDRVQGQQYEDQATAYKKFREEFKDAKDLVASTSPTALPASIRVKLKDPNQYAEMQRDYADKPGVDRIINQQQTLDKIFSILGGVQNLAVVVAIVQGLAALLLVANTIQVAAYSRRREVGIMKLVGASNWFIQLPFVLEAVFAGIIGAVLSFVVLLVTKGFVLDGPLSGLFSANFISPITWNDVLLTLPILLGVAAVISAVTGWLTLRFRLRT